MQFSMKISDYIGLTNNEADEDPIKFNFIVIGALDSKRKHNTGWCVLLWYWFVMLELFLLFSESNYRDALEVSKFLSQRSHHVDH